VLNGGRRARGDAAGNNWRNENDDAGNFDPVDRRCHLHNQRRSRDGGARCGADGADVRIKRARIQVNATMQLPRKEEASEEERHEEKPL
jgi:hypothetical protein